jgi:ATP-dependent Clp protease ATP-binding subunit ClpA
MKKSSYKWNFCSSRKMGQRSKREKEQVTEENVAEVVSMMSGVPVTKVGKNEMDKLPIWIICSTEK